MIKRIAICMLKWNAWWEKLSFCREMIYWWQYKGRESTAFSIYCSFFLLQTVFVCLNNVLDNIIAYGDSQKNQEQFSWSFYFGAVFFPWWIPVIVYHVYAKPNNWLSLYLIITDDNIILALHIVTTLYIILTVTTCNHYNNIMLTIFFILITTLYIVTVIYFNL